MFYSIYFVAFTFCFILIDGSYGRNVAPVSTNVAIRCPAHSTYKTCVSLCHPSCKRPFGPLGCDYNGICMKELGCNTTCVAGCQCDDGYSVDNRKSAFECIKTEECLCYHELVDLYISSVDSPWLSHNCGISFTCWKGRSFFIPYQCEPEGKCITMGTNKSQQCQSSKCPDGWRYLNSTGSCYKAIYNVTFDQAEEKCQSLGAHLTSIHSAEENSFVRHLTLTLLPNAEFSDNTYIGLMKDYEYKWTDGSTYNYTKAIDAFFPWALGSENGCWFMIIEYSVKTFYFNDFNWSRINCDSVLRSAVCKKRANIPAQANYYPEMQL